MIHCSLIAISLVRVKRSGKKLDCVINSFFTIYSPKLSCATNLHIDKIEIKITCHICGALRENRPVNLPLDAQNLSCSTFLDF